MVQLNGHCLHPPRQYFSELLDCQNPNNLGVVIVSQCICTPQYPTAHLKYMIFVNSTTIKLEGEEVHS